jgi:glycosyltransferase involved in cell wall biosynthesis
MTKLIIQIPCYNEEAALGIALAELPRALPEVDRVEWLIVDDGSRDRTIEVARAAGVDHIVRLPAHQGLSRAFLAGLDGCLRAGADIIVNTDADNQYCARDIPRLIAPILAGEAEIVVGARPIDQIAHFSRTKKTLQKLGSWVVRLASATPITDAPSGFRAMTRNAAMQLHVFNPYTYTIETVIQAGLKGMALTSVPIHTNGELRPSRLVKSIPSYVRRSLLTILRISITYRPFRFFATLGSGVFAVGLLISLRFVYFFLMGDGNGRVQSLILAALLMGTGFFLGVVGLLADLIAVNRQLLEKLDWRIQRVEEKLTSPAIGSEEYTSIYSG